METATIEALSLSDRCLRWALRASEELLPNRVSVCTALHWPSRLVIEKENQCKSHETTGAALTRWQNAPPAVLGEPKPAPTASLMMPLAEQFGGVVTPAVRFLSNVDGVRDPSIRLHPPHLCWRPPREKEDDRRCDNGQGGRPSPQHEGVGFAWTAPLPPLGGYVAPISSNGESIRFALFPATTVAPPRRCEEDPTASYPESSFGEPRHSSTRHHHHVWFVPSAVQGTATLRSRFYEYAVRIHLWPSDDVFGGGVDMARWKSWTRHLYRLQLRFTSQILPSAAATTTTKKRSSGSWDRVSTAALVATLLSDSRWSYSIACVTSNPLPPTRLPLRLGERLSNGVVSLGATFDSGVQRSFLRRVATPSALPCGENSSKNDAVCYWRWRWTSVWGLSLPTRKAAEAPEGGSTAATEQPRGTNRDVGLHSCHTAQLLAEVPLRSSGILLGLLRLRLLARVTSSTTPTTTTIMPSAEGGGSEGCVVTTKDNDVLLLAPFSTIAAQAPRAPHLTHAAWSLQRHLIRNVALGLPSNTVETEEHLQSRPKGDAEGNPESLKPTRTKPSNAILATSCELQMPLRPFPSLDICFFINSLVSFAGPFGSGAQPLRRFSGTFAATEDTLWSAGVSLVPKRRVAQVRWSKWNEKVGLRMECSWLMFSSGKGEWYRRLATSSSSSSTAADTPPPRGEVEDGGVRWLPWRCGVVWDMDAATDDGVAS